MHSNLELAEKQPAGITMRRGKVAFSSTPTNDIAARIISSGNR